MFFLNSMVCQATSRYTDGSLFSTLCGFLAILGIYRFWDSITAGETILRTS